MQHTQPLCGSRTATVRTLFSEVQDLQLQLEHLGDKVQEAKQKPSRLRLLINIRSPCFRMTSSKKNRVCVSLQPCMKLYKVVPFALRHGQNSAEMMMMMAPAERPSAFKQTFAVWLKKILKILSLEQDRYFIKGTNFP